MQTKPQTHISSSLQRFKTLRPDSFMLVLMISFTGIVNTNIRAQKIPSLTILQPSKERVKWIGSPVGKEGEPWFVCLVLSGSSLMYTSKMYAIQARNQSWTAEWRRYRPKPYPTDEGVGLVTTQELALVHTHLEVLADQGGLTAQVTETTPPCSLGDPLYRAHKTEYLAEIWLRKRSKQSKPYIWSYWQLNHPHLSVDQTANKMIQMIQSLVNQVAKEDEDIDGLLTSKESGILILTVTAPSRVWLNGVYHGIWPQAYPIRLAPGVYQVDVSPNQSKQNMITFEGLEITAGTKTKFKVEVE